jgi:hypothetical protein
MPQVISYATQKVTSVFSTLRFVLLPRNNRIPPTYTIRLDATSHASVNVTTSAAAAINAVTIAVTALSAAIPNRSKIIFANGATARLTAAAASAATSLTVEPLTQSIPSGTTGTMNGGQLTVGAGYIPVLPTPVDLWPGEVLTFGTTRVTLADRAPVGSVDLEVIDLTAALTASATSPAFASLYVAGTTDASPSSAPKLVDGTNFLSGAGQEQVTTGTSRTLNFAFQDIVGDPGAELIKQILYNDAAYDREIYAWLTRQNGERYEGACIITTGDSASPVQELVNITANLQFQGSSFKYTPAPGTPAINLTA